MQVVLAVLNLLYVFSKRSNFISRISTEKRQALLTRLTYLAEVSYDHFSLLRHFSALVSIDGMRVSIQLPQRKPSLAL